MHPIIQSVEARERARLVSMRAIPDFQPGDTLRVNVRIREGERERVQAFEGVCIARSGGGVNESFTVRKISFGEGVERVFPVLSPMIESIEVKRRGVVRRAKLYYLRDRRGKSARIAERQTVRAFEAEVILPVAIPEGAELRAPAPPPTPASPASPRPDRPRTRVVEGPPESVQAPVDRTRGSSGMATALRTILNHNHAVSGPEVRQVLSGIVERIPAGPVARADMADTYRMAVALGEHLGPLMFSPDTTVAGEARTAMVRLGRLFFAGDRRRDADVLGRFLRHLDLRLICHVTVRPGKTGAAVTLDAHDLVYRATGERSLLEDGSLSLQLIEENVERGVIQATPALLVPARGQVHRSHEVTGSINDLGGRVITVLADGHEVFSTPADHNADVLFVV